MSICSILVEENLGRHLLECLFDRDVLELVAADKLVRNGIEPLCGKSEGDVLLAVGAGPAFEVAAE